MFVIFKLKKKTRKRWTMHLLRLFEFLISFHDDGSLTRGIVAALISAPFKNLN